MTANNFSILLVEDDPDDVFFLEEAFKRADMAGALRVVRDGEEAVAYLLGQAAYADRRLFPLPSLILLDLKLPRKSGLEVLEWRRHQPEVKKIPVVVLTSSLSDADIASAYELGANSYLVKPIDSGAQLEMVKALRLYWIGLNKAPEMEAGRRPA
ncbi:MAG: response regulator [Elusimicrobia bacterium]|nr:response regulator [Elusimicrobiota bacterium]